MYRAKLRIGYLIVVAFYEFARSKVHVHEKVIAEFGVKVGVH